MSNQESNTVQDYDCVINEKWNSKFPPKNYI